MSLALQKSSTLHFSAPPPRERRPSLRTDLPQIRPAPELPFPDRCNLKSTTGPFLLEFYLTTFDLVFTCASFISESFPHFLLSGTPELFQSFTRYPTILAVFPPPKNFMDVLLRHRLSVPFPVLSLPLPKLRLLTAPAWGLRFVTAQDPNYRISRSFFACPLLCGRCRFLILPPHVRYRRRDALFFLV